MEQNGDDINRAMMLDGNAVAGALQEVFSAEMTDAPTQCANCGQKGMIGGLLAFVRAPGIVLRCPACEAVMIRIARVGRRTYVDTRGAVYVVMPA